MGVRFALRPVRHACTAALATLILLPGVPASGQAGPTLFQKAPPDVETALRARVSRFYELHVSGEFRKAEGLVHEDSKDVYYSGEKTRFESFEIRSISYEENFTRAKVVVQVPWEMVMPGFGKTHKMPRPIGSNWKLDSGEWYWYVIPVDPCKGVDSPFGKMHRQECKDGKPVPSAPGGGTIPADPSKGILVRDLHSKVKLTPARVELQSHLASSAEATVRNDFVGPIELNLRCDSLPGLSTSLSTAKLAPGESAVVRIAYKPLSSEYKTDRVCRIQVIPIAQVLTLTIGFAPPLGGAIPAK